VHARQRADGTALNMDVKGVRTCGDNCNAHSGNASQHVFDVPGKSLHFLTPFASILRACHSSPAVWTATHATNGSAALGCDW
jgi:hypothetical protein